MSNHPNRWTAEDDEVLVELWEAGADAEEIAEALDRSRNSVFSRAAELQLPRRGGAVPWTRAERDTLRKLFDGGRSDAEIAAKLGNRSAYAVSRQRMSMGLVRKSNHQPLVSRPMMVVGPARTCQWIEGDPRAVPLDMCGKPSVEGRSYCAEHTRRAYQLPGGPKPPKVAWGDECDGTEIFPPVPQ